MARKSRVHYISKSSISITPNANGNSSDLAVNISKGAKIKVFCDKIEPLGFEDNKCQEWTLRGLNRQLLENNIYTIYARLNKHDKTDGYLVFAPKQTKPGTSELVDKYSYLTENGLKVLYTIENEDGEKEDYIYTGEEGPRMQSYWYVRLGEVSAPVGGKRTVTFDNGMLGTDEYWSVDNMPIDGWPVWYDEWEPGKTYYAGEENEDGYVEVSYVWHNGCLWRCLRTGTTDEPSEDSLDWSPLLYNGEDGNGIENVFIRTKSLVAPQMIVAEDDYADSNGNTVAEDGFLPLVVSDDREDDIEYKEGEDDTRLYECTDEPKDVSEDWPYVWCIYRSKDVPDDNGKRKWKKYTGSMSLVSKWTKDGKNSVRIDLDNQLQSIQTDSTGRMVVPNNIVSAEVRLYDGAENVTAEAMLPPVESLKLLGQQPGILELKPEGYVSVKWNLDNELQQFDSEKGYRESVDIVLTYEGVEYKAKYTIVATLGRPVYEVFPIPTQVQFAVDSENNYTPATATAKCEWVKGEIGRKDEHGGNEMTVDGYTLYYRKNSDASWTALTADGVEMVPTDTQVEFCLSSAATAAEVADDNIVDIENVGVMKDGKHGDGGAPGSNAHGLTTSYVKFTTDEKGTVLYGSQELSAEHPASIPVEVENGTVKSVLITSMEHCTATASDGNVSITAVDYCKYVKNNGDEGSAADYDARIPYTSGAVNITVTYEDVSTKKEQMLSASINFIVDIAVFVSSVERNNRKFSQTFTKFISDGDGGSYETLHSALTQTASEIKESVTNGLQNAGIGINIDDDGEGKIVGVANKFELYDGSVTVEDALANDGLLDEHRVLYYDQVNGEWVYKGSMNINDNIVFNTNGSGSLAGGAIEWTEEGELTVSNLFITKDNIDSQSVASAGLADALKKTVYIWGQSFNGTGNVEGDLTLGETAKLKINDDVYFVYDKHNKAVRLVGAGFYSDSFISALGVSSGGSSAGGATLLSGLEDVSISTPISGNILQYNGTEWVNVPMPSVELDSSVYATKTWVEDKGYLTESSLSDYLPLAGGTITGRIYTSGTGNNKGYFLTDSTGYQYAGIVDNGSNLWIGSFQTVAQHHTGETYISAGYNGTTGNATIKISVPNDTNTNATNYSVLHSGNLSSYVTKSYVDNLGINASTLGSVSLSGLLTSVSLTTTKLKVVVGGTEKEVAVPTWNQNTTGSAAKLTTNAGSATQPVYFSGGVPVATTYSLSSTLNSGTQYRLAYYSGANAVSATGNIKYYANQANSLGAYINGLHIWGQTYGNTASTLNSKTIGDIRYGDGNPQISFGCYADETQGQRGALMFTDNDMGGKYTGASFHFVSTEGADGINTWVVSQKFHAKDSIKIGDATISWDSSNGGCLKVDRGIYSTSFVSALGISGGSSSGSTSLSGLDDVNVGSQTDGQALVWSAAQSKWVAGTVQSTINLNVTGTGNAITAISKSGTTITATKGSTFALSSELSGYIKIDGSNGTADGVSALINKLTIGSSVPSDNDYYVCQYVGGDTSITSYHRRPTSILASYIKSKFSAATTGNGNAVTAVGYSDGAFTATKGATFSLANGTNASGTWAISVSGNAATATNADTLDGLHASSFAQQAADNNLINHGNEINLVYSAFSGRVWFNYRTTGGTNGSINEYAFGDGAGNALARITNGQFSGNAATATQLADTASKTAWGQTYWSGGQPQTISGDMTGVGSITASGNITSTISATSDLSCKLTNSKGSVGVLASTNRGLYDYTKSKWIIGTEGTNTWLLQGNVGIGTTSPAYKLDVNGTGRYTGTLYVTSSGGGVTINSSGTLSASSTISAGGNIEAAGSLRTSGKRIYFGSDSEHYIELNDNGFHFSHGLYSESFVSALGLNSSSSSSGSLSVVDGVVQCSGMKGQNICYECDSNGENPTLRTNEINNYSHGIHLQYNSSNNVTMCYGGGKVGIGTASPAYKLDVNGNARFTSTVTFNANIVPQGNIALANNKNIYLGNAYLRGVGDNVYFDGTDTDGGTVSGINGMTITASSDIRLKNVIQDVNGDINEIANAPIFRFTWKSKRSGRMYIGTSAQYWQTIYPELVFGDSENESLSLDYASLALTASVTAAREIVLLKERVKALEQELEQLKSA